jgi:hypothetical protein
MKRLLLVTTILIFTLALPCLALASSMQHGHGMAGMDEGFVEIGKDTRDGVVATVSVKTYDEKAKSTMAKAGMNATHHVMVTFADAKSGAAITEGQAAVKVKGEDSKPVMMMLMGTGFGGDVALPGPGMYTFEIGSKLADGNKRQFEVGYHNM